MSGTAARGHGRTCDEKCRSWTIDLTDFEVTQIGALDEWRAYVGAFDRTRSRDGRRIVGGAVRQQLNYKLT
jgi:hypothetical protein